MDERRDPGAANRGRRPGPAGGEVTGSGAGAGGGGAPEDFDTDPQGGGGKAHAPVNKERGARKENDPGPA